jgi:hypothetical protein
MQSRQAVDDYPGDPDQRKPGLGGHAPGLALSIGRSILPWLGVSFEYSQTARMHTVQELRYTFLARYDMRYRDTISSGVVVVRDSRFSHVIPEAVVGIGVARESMIERSSPSISCCPTGTPAYGPYGQEESFSRSALVMTYGANADIRFGKNVSVVPQVRFHWIPREFGSIVIESFVFRPALGLRVWF